MIGRMVASVAATSLLVFAVAAALESLGVSVDGPTRWRRVAGHLVMMANGTAVTGLSLWAWGWLG